MQKHQYSQGVRQKAIKNKCQTKTSSISRSVKITDGDSIKIGNSRIRLQGIDAPELKQKCKKKNQEYSCGLIT